MASDVVEADAAGAVEVDEGGCCEDVEVRLVPAEEVPFDEEEAAAGCWAGVRVVVEVFFAAGGRDLSLLGLRVEPTSLRKREFMDDIQRGAFLAGAWRGRGEEGEKVGGGSSRRGERVSSSTARRSTQQQQAQARGGVDGLQVRWAVACLPTQRQRDRQAGRSDGARHTQAGLQEGLR